MSKNDMVMVPREVAEAILGNAAQGYFSKDHGDALRVALKAQQHQSEPVAWWYWDEDDEEGFKDRILISDLVGVHGPESRDHKGHHWVTQPLYTHADPAEVERLRDDLETMRRKNNEYWHETEVLRAHLGEAEAGCMRLRAQLAEAHALLQQAVDNEESFNFDQTLISRIKTNLSASAEPSARPSQSEPVGVAVPELQFKSYPSEEGWTYCTFRADDVPAGTKLFTLESMGAEPSAPVEIDERAEFEKRFGPGTWGHVDWTDERIGWRSRAFLARKP